MRTPSLGAPSGMRGRKKEMKRRRIEKSTERRRENDETSGERRRM